MTRVILTLNVGSSSLKYAVFPVDQLSHCLLKKNLKRQADQSMHHWLDQVLMECRQWHIVLACHRVVHGGQIYTKPTLITPTVLNELNHFIPLAPNHLTPEIEAIQVLLQKLPAVPQLACFDTAFHSHRPSIDTLYALPKSLTQTGIIRYGFHGLSYDYIQSVLHRYLPSHHQEKIIVAHLGSGASLCAIQNGRSMSTTLGFSALDGLVMGTRCGQIDPGVLLFLMQEKHYTLQDLTHLLHSQSGLLGVSGISADMRELEMSDHPDALLAQDLFAYRIKKEIGSLIAVMGGLDAIIFTAGIGENSPSTRQKIIEQLAWLETKIHTQNNHHNEICISQPNSKVGLYVIPTNEEYMMALYGQQWLHSISTAMEG